MRTTFTALAILLCALMQSDAYEVSITSAYEEVSLSFPTPKLVVICHGFGCGYRTAISLSIGDRAQLAQLLGNGRASAEAERRAVATATAWFDRRIGPAAATTGRIARASVLTKHGPGQMDCIDTSRNNTSLFLIIDQLHLFHYHRVEEPEARGFFIDGRGPHATAVLREIHTGRKWAIDNWTHKFGERPDVLPLDQWMTQR
jgi:hypothetical protein